MDRLGPFEPRPRLAAAVSGGADSMALALLADGWAKAKGGTVLALTVDHRLRPEAAAEAATARFRLAARGIASRGLTLANPPRGPGLAEQARIARYRALAEACAGEGIVHLLLGHHRGDQAETAMLRVLSASGARGLAGMAALAETGSLRLVRPLLDVAAVDLRAFLIARGVAWVEDPSNRDPASARARLRQGRSDGGGTGEGTRALADAMRNAGEHRANRDRAVADIIAIRAAIYPEGHARLTPGPIDPEALAALLRTVGGTPHLPSLERVARLARDPGPATIGGVRILGAGRLGPGWLLVREPRAMAPPIPARPGAVWDGRFRLAGLPEAAISGPASDLGEGRGQPSPDRDPQARPAGRPWRGAGIGGRDKRGHDDEGVVPSIDLSADRPDPATLGALGADAARFRPACRLPAAILHGIPAVRVGDRIVAVPHIGVGDPTWRVLFAPPLPAAGAPFAVG